MTRQRLLFLSPIMPDGHGNGLAMRAGVALCALSRRFEVHLGLVPVAGGPQTPSLLALKHAATMRSLPLAEHLDPHYRLIERVIDPSERRRAAICYPKPYLSRFCTSQSASVVEAWRRDVDAAALHVIRLYLAPLAYGSKAGIRVLDIDEDDVTTYRRIAGLHREAGAQSLAEMEEAEAGKFAILGSQHLERFHRVLVSSPVEAERICERTPGAAIAVVPNAVPPAIRPVRRAGTLPDRPLGLLFVGNLGYPPNEDAVIYFCREILPRIQAGLNRPVTLRVAGAGATDAIIAAAAGANARLLGPVENLAALYAEADLAVAPIRAGGGTRIKILEAFAFEVPVVATSVAIEGIAANSGEQALIGDGPDAFARACLALAADPERAHGMAARARQLVNDVYGTHRIETALLAAYDTIP